LLVAGDSSAVWAEEQLDVEITRRGKQALQTKTPEEQAETAGGVETKRKLNPV
jgi:hypothetical protein